MTRWMKLDAFLCLFGCFSFSWLAHGEQDANIAAEKTRKWEISGGLGASLSQGNQDTMVGNISADAKRTWTDWELLLGASGEYGETENQKSAEKAKGAIQGNWVFSKRFYGFLLNDMERDALADVEYRFKAAPGMGCKAILTDTCRWNLELGPGYMREKLGDGTEDDIMNLRMFQRYELRIKEGLKVWESVEYLPSVKNFSDSLLHGEMGIETSLSQHFSLRFVLKDTYDSVPAEGRERNDLSLIGAILWKW